MTHKPVITLVEPIHSSGLDILRKNSDLYELTGPEDQNLNHALQNSQAIIVRSTRLDATILQQAPKLQVIGRHGAGTDNIDLDFAAQFNIEVVNTPRSNSNSVAEYVITTALMLLKGIVQAEGALRDGAFSEKSGSLPGQVQRLGLAGQEITSKKIGLVGAGAIGQLVAKKAQALGMSVAAYDPFLPSSVLESAGITPAQSLESLLPQVDILSMHVPGGDAPIITKQLLALLPEHAVVINASRGNVIDENALAQALKAQEIKGAAVDVFSHEPPGNHHVLMQAPNLLATPHMAAMTEEAIEQMAIDVANRTLRALTQLKN